MNRGPPDDAHALASPPAEGATEVRSLVRGLDVLIAVNEAPPATVAQIVTRTGLPKATVVRLLATLRRQDFIAQDRHGQGYRPLPKVRQLASAMMVENPFLAEARRLLLAFGSVTKWPSDLLLAEAGGMVIVASNRDSAPIRLERHEQRRFPLLDSAAGAAYLALLEADERERQIAAAVAGERDRNRGLRLADGIRDAIEAFHRRGYSVRDYSSPIEGTRVLGVGLSAAGRAVGALVLITLRDVVSADQFEDRLLPALREQAGWLGEQYALFAPQSGSRRPTPVGDAAEQAS